ncbi:MAG: phosphatase PAP2 family protein [Bacilli bacterium]|nr:phosphatase PAP2 family protein [Bacilli bacterium]
MKRKIWYILLTALFLVLLILYKFNKLEFIDDYFYKIIISIKNDNITNIMKNITFLASTNFILLLMLILFILSIFNYKIPIIINILIIIETIINHLIKIIIRRDRPILINLVEETSFSFPSGHTMVSVILYGFIIYIVNKSKLDKIYKIIIISLLSLLILLIMISRIYLGVHYFSDVIAGFTLALAILLLAIDIIERKKIL